MHGNIGKQVKKAANKISHVNERKTGRKDRHPRRQTPWSITSWSGVQLICQMARPADVQQDAQIEHLTLAVVTLQHDSCYRESHCQATTANVRMWSFAWESQTGKVYLCAPERPEGWLVNIVYPVLICGVVNSLQVNSLHSIWPFMLITAHPREQ